MTDTRAMTDVEWLDDLLTRHGWRAALPPARLERLRANAIAAMRDAGRDVVRRMFVERALWKMAVLGARAGGPPS